MIFIKPENKPLNPNLQSRYRVIITNSSGQVVMVSREYVRKSSALIRLEKETQVQLPTLYGAILEYKV